MEAIEKPRELFLKACDEIAKRVEVHGFTYAKSGPHLTKKLKILNSKLAFHLAIKMLRGITSLFECMLTLIPQL